MSKNTKWVLGAIVVIIIIGAWWVSQNRTAPAEQSAAAVQANAAAKTGAGEAVVSANKTSVDIATALQANDAAKMAALQAELQATAGKLATLAPLFKMAVNIRSNSGKDVGAGLSLAADLDLRISYLQATTLSLANARATLDTIKRALADISGINAALAATTTTR